MPTKPDMVFPESRGDVTLDPFQLDALRPLLLEQEIRIKSHFDRRMEQLSMLLQQQPMQPEPNVSPRRPSTNVQPTMSVPVSPRRPSTSVQPTVSIAVSPDEQLGMRAGVAPHLIQLIDRVKAENGTIFHGQGPFSTSFRSLRSVSKIRVAFRACKKRYDHVADWLVVVYSICMGVEIQATSMRGSEPEWAREMEMAFCIIFSLDLLIRLFIERRRFFRGSRRWWNLFDALAVSMLLAALLEGSRMVGNVAALIRTARVLRLARFLQTFNSALTRWTDLKSLRVLLTSMVESLKVMVWLVLLVGSFIYVCALLLTESIWDTCPSDTTPLVCERFGNLLTSSMTLYQIMYHGILWGELWNELRGLQWYIQGIFLMYLVFAMMILVNTITSFICSLQSTVSKRERDVLIDNAMDHTERLVRQLYRIFQDFDQNGNGAISWAEFQLALADERMHAFLSALELDMSDAVKVFQILASEKTGAIEESDFLLGCLRLRGGATAVDMVRMQMEQEWMRSALLQMKDMMQKTVRDVAIVHQTLQKWSPVWERALQDVESQPDVTTAVLRRQNSFDAQQGTRRQGSVQSLYSMVSSSSDEPIHDYQRTDLKTFERAVTLEQLNIIDQELERWCRGWKDAFTGETISVETLNLYQYSYHHILSHTAPPDGVLLQWPASVLVGDLPQIGAEVHQRCPHMKLPRARGKVIGVDIDRTGREKLVISVRLLQGLFRSVEEEVLSADGVELPADEMTVTAVNSICYKEFLSQEACLPVWYCSHWWGEPIRAFVQCCQEHSNLRRLGNNSYWVCGYANRQHELDLEIAEDVLHSSFFSALSASSGLLLILDEAATPFSRIWCDYELYSAVTNVNMELDIAATITRNGRQEVEIITKNLVPGESAVAKSAREQDFPIFLLDRGLEVCLERGNTTQERDKKNIFQAIAQSDDLESIDGQERFHRNLSRANQTLHSTLAVLAWPQAMHKNLLPRHGKGLNSGKLNVCGPLLKDTFRESLDLSLAHFEESCTDSVVKTLAESLPLSLTQLKLSFEGCARLTDVSLQALTNRFMQLKLKQLFLDFVGCQNLTDAGLRLLGAFLQKSALFELELHFAGCSRLHGPGISALKENLPSSIRSFKGSFKGTQINRNFKDLTDFKDFKFKPAPLRLPGRN